MMMMRKFSYFKGFLAFSLLRDSRIATVFATEVATASLILKVSAGSLAISAPSSKMRTSTGWF